MFVTALLGFGLGCVARAKDIEIHTDEIVVDPAAVEGKETHHSDHVFHLSKKLERTFFDCVLEKD